MKTMNDILKQKKNPVMNYNQFMSIFKSAPKKYGTKGSKDSKDTTKASKINQELASDGAKAKKTPALDKYTRQHLGTVKKKNIVKK